VLAFVRPRVIVTSAALFIMLAAGASQVCAQTMPTPAPSPTPSSNPFTFRGYFRLYDLTRQNASTGIGGANQVNQAAVAPAISLHADYRILDSGFSIGGSYLYATPLDGCPNPVLHQRAYNATTNPCGFQAAGPMLNPDDTLPDFALNTFYEAYVTYEDQHLYAKVGDQVINTPWANASDSRLKPVAFQGADVAYRFTGGFSIDAMDMDEFESRTSSGFDQETLLTSLQPKYAGSGLPSYLYYAGGNGVTTPGFQYLRLGYNGAVSATTNLNTNLYLYDFDDIAGLEWADWKYTWNAQPTKPYLALQGGLEHNDGTSVLGTIDSLVMGAQLGAQLSRTVSVAASWNELPRREMDLTSLPTGVSCSAKYQISTKAGDSFPWFLPSNAPECVKNANGTYTVQYGGVASPYTDSYATDPLYTTSLTQGMVDRRAPGDGMKVAATYTTLNKRFIFTVSRAYYDYGFLLATEQTAETDADAQWYAMPLRPGPYHGLLLRYRYGARTLDNVTTYGGLPLFKYNRAQLEYDF
jgi:hypothetical protein